MKKLLMSVAVAGLFASPAFVVPAFSQEHRDEHGGGEPHGGGAPHAAPAQPQAQPHPHAPEGGRPPEAARPAPPPQAMHREDHRPPAPGPAMAGPHPGGAMTGPHPGERGGPNRGDERGPGMAGPGMRGPGLAAPRGGAMTGPRGGNHADFSSFHRNFNAPHRFHAPTYRRPPGWYAHRWSYGEMLPPIFWAHDYWINDFEDYGLMGPPPGAVWVRYGDDALLIDQYSGEVIQVEYGVFY